ncbi:MAG: ATP-binding protein [Candidatus Zixiibacteriota bacterium]
MRRRKVFRQFLVFYLFIMLLSLAATLWYTNRLIKQTSIDQARQELAIRCRLLTDRFTPFLNPPDTASLQRVSHEIANATLARVSVFLPDGTPLASSESDIGSAASPGQRPELAQAIRGETGFDRRFNRETNGEFLFVAVPLVTNRTTTGILRIGQSLESIGSSTANARFDFLVIGVIVMLLSVVIGILVARQISQPIQDLRADAERFARGDLNSRVVIPDADELAPLAEAMDEMAKQLDDRIKTITRQTNEQDAILASMVEGVLAVDTSERIMSFNRTASQLFGILPSEAVGKTIQEVVRNVDLQDLVSETIRTGRTVNATVILSENGELHLQAHGTVLKDAEGRSLGALLVLHDITQLKKLESVRRDFVANVSHELKTPITSIKGFVETLQDGAVSDPADAERFLAIISKHVDRLNAIIEDLLALSRIELEAERAEIVLEPGSLLEIVSSAVQACGPKAKDRSVSISIVGEPVIIVRRNPVLLEQAVVNLLDNAIKYSESGGAIEVEVNAINGEAVVSVRDHGCGIPREHLPRLWERFYRVDRARSRSLGGTGLGLAIVKHIVLAHGGRVAVESTVGQGSVFRIYLPIPGEAA